MESTSTDDSHSSFVSKPDDQYITQEPSASSIHSQTISTNFNVFEDGFGAYAALLDSHLHQQQLTPSFRDLKLITKDKIEYNVHKLILTYASGYFERILATLAESNTIPRDADNGNVGSQQQSVLVLDDAPFTSASISLLLKYLYEGKVEFSLENSTVLLSLAEYFEISPLKQSAMDFLVSNITRDNALSMLQQALGLNAQDVVTRCLQAIAKSFSWLVRSGADFSFIPVPTLVRLTKRNNLAVSSEIIVYNMICDYIDKVAAPFREGCVEVNGRTGPLSQEEINQLFETLKEVEKNPLVPSYLMTEAQQERLKKQELMREEVEKRDSVQKGEVNNIITAPISRRSGSFSRFQPRATYCISFEYTSDFDEKGVFYYIGTKGYTESYSNPAARGRIRVSSSSVQVGNIIDILNYHSPKEFWTMDVPASWVQVSLGSTRTLIPNYYTIRHGGQSRADALRVWMLQGSNNGKNWVVLKRHVNETPFVDGKPFGTQSWPITDVTQSFRQFRILQNGHNSSSNNFLSISGIEIYGDLYEKDPYDGYISP